MKEQYTSPQVQVVCFVSTEALAGSVSFKDLLNVSDKTPVSPATPSAQDILIDLTL